MKRRAQGNVECLTCVMALVGLPSTDERWSSDAHGGFKAFHAARLVPLVRWLIWHARQRLHSVAPHHLSRPA